MAINQGSRSRQRDGYNEYADYVNFDDVTIVIPTLNEELAIGSVVEETINEGFSKILVVDGHSIDNTVKIANQYGIKVLEQHGIGKTGALKTAIDHVKTPYMIIIDGDMTYDPKDFVKFLPHLNSYDEIIGIRKNGRENIPLLNRLGNWLINKTFNTFFGTNMNDVCSGLYSLNTKFAQNLVLDTQGFDVEVEIAAQAAWVGSISQIPISFRERVGIQKLQPFQDGLKILSTIFRLGLRFNPVSIFSGIAALSMIPALMLLGWSFFQWILGTWFEGVAFLGLVLLLFSIQAVSLGVVSAQHKRIEHRLLRQSRERRER